MRLCQSLLILLVVAGCTNQSGDYETLSVMLAPTRQPVPARVQALVDGGAPQLQVGFPQSGRSGTMLLEQRRGRAETWISVDGATLITERGMLTGTRGLGAGLMAADISQSLALVLSGRPGRSLRFHSYLTGNDEIVTRSYSCRIEDRGARKVNLTAGAVRSWLMAELCRNPDQDFVNLYWISDATGRMVQSRQWTGAYLGPVSTRARCD